MQWQQKELLLPLLARVQMELVLEMGQLCNVLGIHLHTGWVNEYAFLYFNLFECELFLTSSGTIVYGVCCASPVADTFMLGQCRKCSCPLYNADIYTTVEFKFVCPVGEPKENWGDVALFLMS